MPPWAEIILKNIFCFKDQYKKKKKNLKKEKVLDI